MVEVKIMPSALQDIQNIIEYVYVDSVKNAEKLLQELLDKINSLQQFPERGGLVKEMENPLIRELKLYHYRIIYFCDEQTVNVLTVHHSARLLQNNPHLKDLL